MEESAAVSHAPENRGPAAADLGPVSAIMHDLAGNVAGGGHSPRCWIARTPGYLADFIAQNTALRYRRISRQILEELSPLRAAAEAERLLSSGSADVLGFEREMEGKVRDRAGSAAQQEQILRTQIRVLQNELGEDEDDETGRLPGEDCGTELGGGDAGSI